MKFNSIVFFLAMLCIPLLLQAVQTKSRGCSANDIQLTLDDYEFFPTAPTLSAPPRRGAQQSKLVPASNPVLVYYGEDMRLTLKAPKDKTYTCHGVLKWNHKTRNTILKALIFSQHPLHPKASIFVNWSQFLQSQQGVNPLIQQTLLRIHCTSNNANTPEVKEFSQSILFVPKKYKRSF